MKKFFLAIAMLLIGVATFDACAGIRKDVFISYDQLGTDAAFKQFRKANRINKAEILNNLVDQANAEYRKCETLDDLHNVKENLHLIKLLINDRGSADAQKFIAITKRIRELDYKIDGTIAEVSGQQIIQVQGGTTSYGSYGQQY